MKYLLWDGRKNIRNQVLLSNFLWRISKLSLNEPQSGSMEVFLGFKSGKYE